jgi:hypothetical protein
VYRLLCNTQLHHHVNTFQSLDRTLSQVTDRVFYRLTTFFFASFSDILKKIEVFTAVTVKNGVFWDVTPVLTRATRRNIPEDTILNDNLFTPRSVEISSSKLAFEHLRTETLHIFPQLCQTPLQSMLSHSN